VPRLNGCRPHEIRNQIRTRANLRCAAQVYPLENVTVIDGRGLQSEGDGFTTVESAALDRDFAR
jgi:hypothetical protein